MKYLSTIEILNKNSESPWEDLLYEQKNIEAGKDRQKITSSRGMLPARKVIFTETSTEPQT